ncbi:hypothetical protein FRC07_003085 [Ceratobasidium sp. 392]|nr:hypothetical protein FRC07_003085 [Ceratobasidium sp. 392]
MLDETSEEEKSANFEANIQGSCKQAKYEKKLEDAQEAWTHRRMRGYEDYGEEMAQDAQIWQAYVKETDKSDQELVDGWNK